MRIIKQNISKNIVKIIILLIILGIMLFLWKIFKIKEGYSWSNKSKNDFLSIQKTNNPNNVFDINIMQQQASQEEVDYYNTNNKWPWSQDVINLYTEAINKNPYIRIYSGDSVNNAQKIYNQQAILTIMSYETKEGNFLLNGIMVNNPFGNKMEDLPSGTGQFGYNSGLIRNLSADIIKCNMKKENNTTLERINYTGKGGIFGEQTKNITQVDYTDLENILPGFSFINGACNPCSALNKTPDYSCKFDLKTKNSSSPSNIWQYLWSNS